MKCLMVLRSNHPHARMRSYGSLLSHAWLSGIRLPAIKSATMKDTFEGNREV